MLFGLCTQQKPYILVMQYFGINGRCLTLNRASKGSLITSHNDWVRIFKEVAETMLYIHSRKYLHNDIKGDNIVLTERDGFRPVLIDFGKACTLDNAKFYHLNDKEKEKYRKCHCHIAPELVRGTHAQSLFSDIYSLGMLMLSVCKLHHIDKCQSLISSCLHCCPNKRPELFHVQQQLSLMRA